MGMIRVHSYDTFLEKDTSRSFRLSRCTSAGCAFGAASQQNGTRHNRKSRLIHRMVLPVCLPQYKHLDHESNLSLSCLLRRSNNASAEHGMHNLYLVLYQIQNERRHQNKSKRPNKMIGVKM